MLASFVLSLREGLEAALIIGIVLGVLRKMDKQSLNPAVWAGVSSAIVVSFLAAIGLNWIGAEFEGQGEQLFEGITMLLAAAILTWMVFWMRKQSGSMKKDIEAGVQKAAVGRGGNALFFLAFLAVVREGIELVLFLLAARLAFNPLQEVLGVILGLALAALAGWVIFTTSLRLSLTGFFKSTNILLAIFAAGLVGLGIHEFNELGWIPAVVEHVWDLNAFLSNQSLMGQLLKGLVGYSSNPSLSQVIGYLGYFVLLFVILGRKRPASGVSQPTPIPE